MKKILFVFAVAVLLSGCATTVNENTPTPGSDAEVVDTVSLNLFTFTLPSGWTLVSQTATTAKISIPDYETYTLLLDMSLTETGAGALPDPQTTVETTSDGIQIYTLGCGGAFDCGNLAYFGVAYNYGFTIDSTQPVPENLDGIWSPNSSVSHEDIAAFISTVKVKEDIGYGDNEDGSNENILVGYGSNDRIPAPEGWTILVQGEFTLYAPSGWVLTPEKNTDTDTYVGTVSGDGITLRYNYGVGIDMFSDAALYYDIINPKINGWDATIYALKTASEGPSPVGLEIRSPRGVGDFTLSGANFNADQKAVVFNIFRTVFFGQ